MDEDSLPFEIKHVRKIQFSFIFHNDTKAGIMIIKKYGDYQFICGSYKKKKITYPPPKKNSFPIMQELKNRKQDHN